MPTDNNLFGLSAEDKNKLQRLLDDHTNGKLFNRPQRALPFSKESGHLFVRAYGIIPAANDEGCPGKGECKVLKHLVETDPDGCLDPTDEIIEVYNPASVAYENNTVLIIQREARDGQYWIIPTGGTEIVHYELTATLAFGGTALANKLVYDTDANDWVEDEEADPIRVFDWYGNMWAGIATYRGLAVDRGDSEYSEGQTIKHYDIIWQQQIAETIEFTTTQYRGENTEDPDEITATVTMFDNQGMDPGSSTVVHDPFDRFLDIAEGAKGSAKYDYSTGKYIIISSQRLAIFAKAVLTADLCGSETVTSISTHAVLPVGDYVQAPDWGSCIFNNPCKHYGKSGDKIRLRRIDNVQPATNWEIIDVEKHMTEVLTAIRIDGLNLQVKTREVNLEWCDATPEWETWHTGDEC